MLQSMGIWNGPRGWDDLINMPRYFPGRPILVKAPVELEHDLESYMTYKQASADKFVTHRAQLIGMDPASKTFIVQVDGKEDGPLSVPI